MKHSSRNVVFAVIVVAIALVAVVLVGNARSKLTGHPASAGSAGSANSGSASTERRAAESPTRTVLAGTGGSTTSGLSGFVNGTEKSSSEPPKDVPQRSDGEENEHEDTPLTPIDLNPVVKTTSVTAPEVAPPQQARQVEAAAFDQPSKPEDFYFYQMKDLVGDASLIGEASHASSKFTVLETWNWGVGASVDAGRTWHYYNPYTLFREKSAGCWAV